MSPRDPARWTASLALGSGVLALAVRVPSLGAVLVTSAVGIAGGLAPVATRPPAPGRPMRWLAVAALGGAAFLAVALAAPPARVRAQAAGVLAGAVAAVAEELFFRRSMYGWLARWGPAVAIGVSSLAFAAVHVPAYGIAAFPIDIGAGLLLGWQRWASGGWTAPALAHVVANLLASR